MATVSVCFGSYSESYASQRDLRCKTPVYILENIDFQLVFDQLKLQGTEKCCFIFLPNKLDIYNRFRTFIIRSRLVANLVLEGLMNRERWRFWTCRDLGSRCLPGLL